MKRIWTAAIAVTVLFASGVAIANMAVDTSARGDETSCCNILP